MGSSEAPPSTVPPRSGIVPARRAGAIEVSDGRLRGILEANREFTFGYLLGYLSLALHSTLQYPKYAGVFIGPWIEPDGLLPEPLSRVWGRTVSRRSTYAPVTDLGRLFAVLSDGLVEPWETFLRLGVPEHGSDPPMRVAVRPRLPRVDLVIGPAPGCAFELYGFAREVGERFRRNLD